MNRNADILITVDGVSILMGKTEAGKDWLGENCDFDRAFHSPVDGIPAESAYAEDAAIGAIQAGLQVDVNGRPTEVANGRVVYSE